MPTTKRTDISSARVLDAGAWAEMREQVQNDSLVGVELTAGPSGTAVVDAKSGNKFAGAFGHGIGPVLESDLRRAIELVRAQGGNAILLSSSYSTMLTRFSGSSGIDESPEGEDKLRARVDEVMTELGAFGIAVAIQSRFVYNNYTFQGIGA